MITAADFTYRLGGPGRHCRRLGRWFDPASWAIIAASICWLVLMLRQLPCRPVGVNFPNAFLRLCYTDIPVLYLGRNISTGAGFYSEVPLEYPVLTGYFMELARTITRLLGAQVNPQASYAEQVAASQIFFQVCAVLLFCCFCGTVIAHLRMARPRRRGQPKTLAAQARSWDVLLIAASPIVAANGLINWDMLVVMLTSVGLLIWGRRYPFIAGGALGLAFAAKFYPILVLIAITLLCIRSDRYRSLLRLWVGAVFTWMVVNMPVMVTAWDGWLQFWLQNADRGADLGSIWYVATLIGLKVPALSAVAFACMAFGGLAVVWLVMNAPRRPRLGQVALLLLIIFLVFNKVYSPQYALWLLPLVVLARPVIADIAVWTAAELIYFAAIWGFLQGLLGIGTGSDWIYWMAVLIRVCVQLWLALQVVNDIWRPWEDPVRKAMVDDPIGGICNHSADASWLLAMQARSRRARRLASRTAPRRAAMPENEALKT